MFLVNNAASLPVSFEYSDDSSKFKGTLARQVRTSSQSDIIIFIAMRAGFKWYREYFWNLNLSLQTLNQTKIDINFWLKSIYVWPKIC